jgi:hypothetical protein
MVLVKKAAPTVEACERFDVRQGKAAAALAPAGQHRQARRMHQQSFYEGWGQAARLSCLVVEKLALHVAQDQGGLAAPHLSKQDQLGRLLLLAEDVGSGHPDRGLVAGRV